VPEGATELEVGDAVDVFTVVVGTTVDLLVVGTAVVVGAAVVVGGLGLELPQVKTAGPA
jgi:hypothetical protein